MTECSTITPTAPISAIINVHYYTEKLLALMMNALKRNGLLIMETIDGRGGNYKELPQKGYIRQELHKNNFDILYYQEKPVKPYSQNKVFVKAVARKA